MLSPIPFQTCVKTRKPPVLVQHLGKFRRWLAPVAASKLRAWRALFAHGIHINNTSAACDSS